ncbi:hypothetical protein [Cellvibrio fibrivorans]|uniref:Uncharacterized protein n=1 Tax=Cellvibrio fibrivorans TaxID=126350 RepID=A0ABU1V1H1_9GAMM|nr:hypothetical protein [Cellvibrio fibrivorans]MDR7091292.1 hypothetical protein [Cellvibrio fibrivorans]
MSAATCGTANVITYNHYQRNRLTDPLNPIRQLIQQAQEQDSATGKLLEFVECRKKRLHAAIKLPEQQAAKGLADFVVRYIKHVPDFIDAIRSMAHEAGIDKDVEPLLKIASDYFMSPPSIVDPHSQLEALLDEAYLAHRLLEEVNDRFMAKSGIPLAPMDMTVANVIAHELIGEPFANELDQAVLFSAELLLNEHGFEGANISNYVNAHRERGWTEELEKWPCLVEDLSISVEFDTENSTRH